MITIVSGFQRCGSSLMLQMLRAGGLKVFHDAEMGYPAFETQRTVDSASESAWLEALDGQALKWLEPRHTMPASVRPELRIIWMKRDFNEQARSAVKFMRHVVGLALPRETRRVFAASYRRDEPSSVSAWGKRGKVHVQRFEHLIENPQQAAIDVQLFLAVPLNVAAMVNEVRERRTACLDGFLEMELLASLTSDGQ